MNKRFKAAYLTLLTVGMLANMSVIMAAEENWFTRYGYLGRLLIISAASIGGLHLGGLHYGIDYSKQGIDRIDSSFLVGLAVTLTGAFGLIYSYNILDENPGFIEGYVNDIKKAINNNKQVEIKPVLTLKEFVKDQYKPEFVLLELDRVLKALEQPNCLQSIKNIVQNNEQSYKDEVYELQNMLRLVLCDSGFVSKLSDAQKTTLKLFKKNNNTSDDVEIVKKVFKALDQAKEAFDDRNFGSSWVMPNVPSVKEAATIYLKLRKLSLALEFI